MNYVSMNYVLWSHLYRIDMNVSTDCKERANGNEFGYVFLRFAVKDEEKMCCYVWTCLLVLMRHHRKILQEGFTSFIETRDKKVILLVHDFL